MAGMRKWNESETVAFIELYEQMECLWNFRNPDYKKKSERDNAIQTIIEAMNMPGLGDIEVKTKIKNLRSTYSQEVIKTRVSIDSGKSPEEAYKSPLKWFPIADRFLSGVIAMGSTNTYSSSKHYETPAVSSIRTRRSTKEHYQQAQSDVSSKPPKKIAKRENHTSNFVMRKVEKDEFSHFGNNVVSQLRELPMKEALICQNELMEVLTKHRIAALDKVGNLCADVVFICDNPQDKDQREHQLEQENEQLMDS